MKIRDGFKFGIGLFLAQVAIVFTLGVVYLAGLATVNVIVQAYLGN